MPAGFPHRASPFPCVISIARACTAGCRLVSLHKLYYIPFFAIGKQELYLSGILCCSVRGRPFFRFYRVFCHALEKEDPVVHNSKWQLTIAFVRQAAMPEKECCLAGFYSDLWLVYSNVLGKYIAGRGPAGEGAGDFERL